MSIVLACNYDTHDHSVALLKDNEIIFASSQERYSRKKNDDRAPLKAISEALEFTNLKPSDIDYLVFPVFPKPKLKYYALEGYRKIKLTNWKWPLKTKNIKRIFSVLLYATGLPRYTLYHLKHRYQINKLLKGFKGEVKEYNHHISHAYSAYYTSGMKKALIFVIEGTGGDFTTSAYKVKNGKFESVFNIEWPHSLGQFYNLVTRILGFNVSRHAGKITGLAALGDSEKCYDLIEPLVTYSNFKLEVNPLVYSLQAEYLSNKKLPKYFKNADKKDLAAGFQRRLEEIVIQIVKDTITTTGINNIALSGGVVANVKMNQKIMELKEVKEIYIHSAMGDDGVAMGSAFACMSEIDSNFKTKKLKNIYFGNEYSSSEIEKEIKNFEFEYKYFDDVEVEIAKLLADNKVVARFNGRMEYGPRSLGNRSVLYSPVDKSVNDWLNKRLNRTEFMPFAPSTLFDYAHKYYKNMDKSKYTAEFMTITYDCTKLMKEQAPACVHVDGTARPNLVKKDANPSYYKIIDEFRKITGIPTLVNTSFNMHEEPIVCSPYDALRAFKLGALDYLAIGNYIVVGKN